MAVDLNSDVGESYGVWTLGDDAAMLRVVSSANVACGFHGGDPSTLRATCAAAAAHGVTIGAQVSYPDLARVRPAVPRHRPGRAARRRALPARRPRRLRPGRRERGRLRQAARRAVPRHDRQRRSGRGRGRRGRRVRPVAGDPRPAGLRVARRRRAGRAGGGVRGLRRPGLPTRRPAVPRSEAGARDHRRRRGGRPGGAHRRRRRGRGGRRRGDLAARPLAVRPRRHSGRRRPAPTATRQALEAAGVGVFTPSAAERAWTIRRYGARALLVDARVRVAALASIIPDVVEVVPGAETVLVVVRTRHGSTRYAQAIDGSWRRSSAVRTCRRRAVARSSSTWSTTATISPTSLRRCGLVGRGRRRRCTPAAVVPLRLLRVRAGVRLPLRARPTARTCRAGRRRARRSPPGRWRSPGRTRRSTRRRRRAGGTCSAAPTPRCGTSTPTRRR